MRRLILLSIFLALAFVLSSCSITNNSFKSLTPEQQDNVIICKAPISELTNDGRVYLVTMKQIQEFLNKTDGVLVYEYASYCKSDHCVNPRVIEEVCKRNELYFSLIAESYDGIFNIPINDTPILAINPVTFGKRLGSDCCKEFFDHLTNTNYKTRGTGRYYLFTDGKFKGCFEEYSDAIKTYVGKAGQ